MISICFPNKSFLVIVELIGKLKPSEAIRYKTLLSKVKYLRIELVKILFERVLFSYNILEEESDLPRKKIKALAII